MIATTYTVKAAQELRERVRRLLYHSGHPALAERLDESLMGTIHGVCGQLLERFAFEACVSPRIEILSEEDAASLLIQAIETTVDFKTLDQLQRFADALGQKSAQTFEYSWKQQVRALLDAARAHDFAPASLAGMGQRSVDELLEFLPAPAADNLDEQSAAAIKSAAERISKNGDETKTTAEYAELLHDTLRALEAHRLPCFENSLGLSAKEVQLEAQRPSITTSQPSLQFFELSSGQFNKGNGALKRLTKDQCAAILADGIAQLLGRGEKLVVQYRQNRERLRAAEPRDVAVLCRTNQAAATVAGKLTQRGYAVTLSQNGLRATPEARLALACLRRLADPTDSLASVEIVALGAAKQPEEWLASRLEYVARQRQETGGIGSDRWGLEGDFVHPALVSLEQARTRLNVLSPSEALDVALESGGVFATVSAWGSTATRASQRRANLESLRAIAVKYEQASAKNHPPTTSASFLYWCDFLAGSETDLQATGEQVNAIFVSTYHQAKGLEWPIVICTDLDTEPRPRLWEVTVTPVDPAKSFDLNQPLANWRLRFWPWPFGQQKSGIPLASNVQSSDLGQTASRKAVEEELRLLYVGLTRSRDLLVLVREKDQPTPWLDGLQAQWLQPGKGQLVLPDKTTLGLQTLQLTPPVEIAAAKTDSVYAWFPARLKPTPKLPARLTPSRQSQLQGSRVGRIMDMLVETGGGWILIDHKSFPGRRSEWPTEAVSYSGQLALYLQALKKLKLPVASVWIHFAVSGGLVEVLLEDNV